MGQDTEFTARKKVKLGSFSSPVARSVRKKVISKPLRRIGRTIKSVAKISASVPYEADLMSVLAHQKYAKAYLATCMKDEYPGTFFVALRQVIQAQMGFADVSKKLHINRQGLYKALSENGNPSMKTIMAILELLSLHFEISG